MPTPDASAQIATHNTSDSAHADIRAMINEHNHDDRYYTETEIDNMEFVTIEDIDAICGASIVAANLNDGVIF